MTGEKRVEENVLHEFATGKLKKKEACVTTDRRGWRWKDEKREARERFEKKG